MLPHYYEILAEDVKDPSNSEAPLQIYMLMNLPGLAVEFLDVFKSIGLDQHPCRLTCKPPIHVRCYTFVKHSEGVTKKNSDVSPLQLKLEEADKQIQLRVSTALNADHFSLTTNWRVRFVRNVAPYKDMYCAEFDMQLPIPEEAFDEAANGDDSAAKRPKIE